MARLVRSDSFFGKIQRGLGSGYLEALTRPAPEVASAVFRCLADDPRISTQQEERDLYYARLLLARGIDEAPIGELLARQPEVDQPGRTDRDLLPLGVLGFLARSGRPKAVGILRDYVRWGDWWSEALPLLGATGDIAAWLGLDQVLRERFPDDDDARQALEDWWDRGEMRDAWAMQGPLAHLLVPTRKLEDPPPADLSGLTAAELLQRVVAHGPRFRNAPTDTLVGRLRAGSAPDRAVVQAAMLGEDLALAAQAIRVLGAVGDSAIIGPARRILPKLDRLRSGKGPMRRAILRGLDGLPAPDALELAREWREARGYRQIIATRLLALHATEDDLPWVVERVRWAAKRHDSLFQYAEILRRFPGSGPFAGFEAIYCRYVPSCCRGDLVEAMSVADPSFATTLAFECLFDCEPRAREAAARTVDTSIPSASARLNELSEDPLEESDVRAASAGRLA